MPTDRPVSPSRIHPSSRSPKKRPTRSFWIKTLAEFSKSGLSAQAFCRLKNLSASSLSTWRKRLWEEEVNMPPAPATFIPLEVMPTERFPNRSKVSDRNQRTSVFAVDDRRCHNSGLSLQLNDSLNINIDQEFHEPTLQRLVQLFSSGVPSEC